MMEKINTSITIETMPTMSQSSSSSRPASNDQVRILDKSEYRQAALTLAEAFAQDDVVMYFVKTEDLKKPTSEKEWKLHVHIMECITYAHCISGLVTTIGPNYDGVALWMPPGKNMDDWCTLIRSGLFSLQWKLSKEGKKRFFTEFIPLLHDTKRGALGKDDDNSWYLVYIGTKPASRGRGYAKALIEHTTRQADVENRISYLECSNALNLKLYRRLGFEFVKKIHLVRSKGPVELDIMTRLPVAQQLAGMTSRLLEDREVRKEVPGRAMGGNLD